MNFELAIAPGSRCSKSQSHQARAAITIYIRLPVGLLHGYSEIWRHLSGVSDCSMGTENRDISTIVRQEINENDPNNAGGARDHQGARDATVAFR